MMKVKVKDVTFFFYGKACDWKTDCSLNVLFRGFIYPLQIKCRTAFKTGHVLIFSLI
jgi:hypothetical protein